jgi:hypothetical protein
MGYITRFRRVQKKMAFALSSRWIALLICSINSDIGFSPFCYAGIPSAQALRAGEEIRGTYGARTAFSLCDWLQL